MQRSYLQDIKKRIAEPRKFIQVIMGPRQVGKTTLITQALHETDLRYIFVSADNIVGDGGTWLKMIWDKARLECRQQKGAEYLLVVDEAQKIDNWSEVVKREWDMDTFHSVPIKLVLLGSSSLLIQKGLTESLTGRFEVIDIPHWSYVEMKEAFGCSCDEYVWFGGYPGAYSLVGDEQRWKRYIHTTMIETSITKDVLLLHRVDKPALLRRLFEIGCQYSAQIVSLTKIQGELNEKGNITTLSNYLELLESARLLGGIEKYSPDVIRQRASKPKFQVYNNALMSSQMMTTFAEARQNKNLWGRLVESAVGCHLQACSVRGDYRVFYWNNGAQEVDFVLQRGSVIVGLEVKSGKASHVGGMKSFDDRYHPTAVYLIGEDGIPVETFLNMDPAALLS